MFSKNFVISFFIDCAVNSCELTPKIKLFEFKFLDVTGIRKWYVSIRQVFNANAPDNFQNHALKFFN